MILRCLNGNDVITAKISDHHPIIHNGILLWNVMMQCRKRNGSNSFNNGFGIIETTTAYQQRLNKIGEVIDELLQRFPKIETIGLCEGPLHPDDVNALFKGKKFTTHFQFHPVAEWGLIMLTKKQNKVCELKTDFNQFEMKSLKDAKKTLINRFQLWKINEMVFALAHFPFGGDETGIEKSTFSQKELFYCYLINELLIQFAKVQFVMCADFNFNPFLINEYHHRYGDRIKPNNSIVLTEDHKTSVTVDGILLSAFQKQKYFSLRCHAGLFNRLKLERNLGQTAEVASFLQKRKSI